MLATVSSLTSANRIKRQCSEYGIYTAVIQTPTPLAKDGCGYSLRFDDSAKSIVETSAGNLGIQQGNLRDCQKGWCGVDGRVNSQG